MLKYRNNLTGDVVDVPEPKDIEAAESNEARGKYLAMHQRRTLLRMDESKKWDRVEERPPPPAPATVSVPTTVSTETSSTATPSRPAQVDPKSDWIDWAVEAHGLNRVEAENLTKTELMAL